ncbi:LysR family transcriptional regulator [Celerinatantimonas sp. YJH-8]|uniref:LysR family transcriptional regulator n=1 Tax=Celerinatantimonas sp. YJH-8 TaxID=3228714 RepID=UPI0038C77D5F
MEIDHLRAFYQLAQDHHYGIAAQHLFITQSALTKKIKRLELDVGVLLFARGRHGAELTPAGKALLPDATRILKQFDKFQRLSLAVSKGTSGQLNIGFGISAYADAPAYIAEFKRCYPNVAITLNDQPSSQQAEALVAGDLQLSFSRTQDIHPPLHAMKLFSDHLAIAVHQREPIDSEDPWRSLRQLNYLQLNPKRGSGLYRQVQSYLAHVHQTVAVVQEADDILTLLALVCAGVGYTIIPARARIICQPEIKLLELTSANASWDIGLLWNHEHEDVLVRNFIEFVK